MTCIGVSTLERLYPGVQEIELYLFFLLVFLQVHQVSQRDNTDVNFSDYFKFSSNIPIVIIMVS